MPLPCHLLTHPDLTPQTFSILETYLDDSHHIQRLLHCTACGQLYFYGFPEKIDWQGGQDPQYRTYIPVATAAEAARLSELSPLELASVTPRLQVDWSSDAQRPQVKWIGD